mgnify:CR=1 FL=1
MLMRTMSVVVVMLEFLLMPHFFLHEFQRDVVIFGRLRGLRLVFMVTPRAWEFVIAVRVMLHVKFAFILSAGTSHFHSSLFTAAAAAATSSSSAARFLALFALSKMTNEKRTYDMGVKT